MTIQYLITYFAVAYKKRSSPNLRNTMKNDQPRLFVVGCGGYGREIIGYLDDIPIERRDFDLKGFIDDDANALVGKNSKFQILGSIDQFDFQPEDMAIIAVANIETKIAIYERLKNKVRFYSFISEDALIGPNVEIGEGAVICPGVKLGAGLKMGTMVSVNVNSVLGHDAIIGDFCSIMPSVDVGGGALIGKEVFIATKAVVSPLIEICDASYLGVGSINIKNTVEPGTYFGNPARRMR